MLGYAYEKLGRLDEAESEANLSRELGAEDDIANEQQWRQVLAVVEARRGRADSAARLAREALALSNEGDPMGRCASLQALATVLELNGDIQGAVEALAVAVDGYERKGLAPLAERAREQLESLRRGLGV